MISERKKKYFEKETRKLTVDGAHRTAWKALRNLFDAERAPAWNILNLAAGKTEETIAEELADHFAAISNEYQPVTDSPPITHENPHTPLSVQQVTQ